MSVHLTVTLIVQLTNCYKVSSMKLTATTFSKIVFHCNQVFRHLLICYKDDTFFYLNIFRKNVTIEFLFTLTHFLLFSTPSLWKWLAGLEILPLGQLANGHPCSFYNDINFCYYTQKLSFSYIFIIYLTFLLVPYCHTSQCEQGEKSPHIMHSISKFSNYK